MNQFNSSQRIGDIVANFPKAADVFKAHKIDFCCGGDRPLSQAIAEQNLNEKEILERLNTLYAELASRQGEDTDWTKESLDTLIDHIVNTHHAYLNAELPRLSELTTTILRVHGAHHPELARVHKLFHELKTELEQHLIKEEVVEFPLIKEYENHPSEETFSKAYTVITELEDEHEGAGRILKELRKVTSDYAVPDDVCNTFVVTYKKLEDLENDIFEHIHLENNILFPAFKNRGRTL